MDQFRWGRDGGMPGRMGRCSAVAAVAAQPDQDGQGEEGHADGAEAGASPMDGAEDEEHAGGAVQGGGGAGWKSLVFHRSAPGLAGTGKTRSRALARLRAMARESLAGAVAARGSPASCRNPRLG